jgi:hypothetical protein
MNLIIALGVPTLMAIGLAVLVWQAATWRAGSWSPGRRIDLSPPRQLAFNGRQPNASSKSKGACARCATP